MSFNQLYISVFFFTCSLWRRLLGKLGKLRRETLLAQSWRHWIERLPLPIYRLVEIVESIVGGAFFFGVEACGPFLSEFQPSLSRSYAGWILGFGSRPRAEGLLGGIRLRNLDTLALDRALRTLRTLHEAQQHGGLLELAIKQLHYNWESSRASSTWFGHLLRETRQIWPRFLFACAPSPSWYGSPTAHTQDSKDSLNHRFTTDYTKTYKTNWLDRQIAVLDRNRMGILPVSTFEFFTDLIFFDDMEFFWSR